MELIFIYLTSLSKCITGNFNTCKMSLNDSNRVNVKSKTSWSSGSIQQMLWRARTGDNSFDVKVLILIWIRNGDLKFLELIVKILVDRFVVSGNG